MSSVGGLQTVALTVVPRRSRLSSCRQTTCLADGFTLVEVLVAVGLLVVALVSLAELLALATRANRGGRTTTSAAILAEQKMEQLRALAWAVDPQGAPISDRSTDLAAFDPTGDCAAAAGGAGVGLSPSPPGVLSGNTDGYVDFVDGHGCGLGGGSTPPRGAMFARRWAIEPLPGHPNDTLVLQVLVTTRVDPRAGGVEARMPEEARLVSVRTRRPR